MEVTVDTRILRDFDVNIAEVRAAILEGLSEVAEDCLAEATTTVPLEEGTLSGTGDVSVDEAGLVAQVGYGTPYACYQHETVGLRHDPGREDHWLEKTVYRNTEKYTDHVARKARTALS